MIVIILNFLQQLHQTQIDMEELVREQIRNMDDEAYHKYLGVDIFRKTIAHLGPISALKFIQNGKMLVTAGAVDGMIMLWSVEKDTAVWDQPPPVSINASKGTVGVITDKNDGVDLPP